MHHRRDRACPILAPQFSALAATGGAASGAFAGTLGNLSTAFLTQQGSAFVSAPNDPKPDQPGGGVWIRGVGGEVTNKFTSTASGSITAFGTNTGLIQANTTCAGSARETFSGAQVGQDISRLNWGNWNVHVGTTAGYLSSHATDNFGGSTDFQVPFFGAYLVATHGRFFADVMVREEFYSANLTNPAAGLFGQQVGARGLSVATSAGYNFALANNWFIEPSAGFIWSRTNVNSFNATGGTLAQGIVSNYTTAPIESEIGRLSLRVGTTVTSGNMIWQPFASASVFHEFAGDVSTTSSSLNASINGTDPITLTSTNTTTRVGTYGQYSLGLAAQVANTGWLGFVRVDYRNGDNIEGWTGNAGVRYQFTPEMIAAVMPTKAPAKAMGTVMVPPTGPAFMSAASSAWPTEKPIFSSLATRVPAPIRVRWARLAAVRLATITSQQLGVRRRGRCWRGESPGDQELRNRLGRDPVLGTQVAFDPAFLTCGTWRLDGDGGGPRRLFLGKDAVLRKGWRRLDGRQGQCRLYFWIPQWNERLGRVPVRSCRNQGLVDQWFHHQRHPSGWMIGYGTEFDLGHNWSAKAEYDYIDFGSRTSLAWDGVTILRDSGAISQAKIGVNYRFSGPDALIARY